MEGSYNKVILCNYQIVIKKNVFGIDKNYILVFKNIYLIFYVIFQNFMVLKIFLMKKLGNIFYIKYVIEYMFIWNI